MIDKFKKMQQLMEEIEEDIKKLEEEKEDLEFQKTQIKTDEFIKTLEKELSGLTRDVNELEIQKEKALAIMEHIEEEQDLKFPEVFQVKKEYWYKLKVLLT